MANATSPTCCILDDLKKSDQRPFIEQLKAIAAMTMSKSQLAKLWPEDRPHMEQLVNQTQRSFEQLQKAPKQYPMARI
jgi:hypothetical protein